MNKIYRNPLSEESIVKSVNVGSNPASDTKIR